MLNTIPTMLTVIYANDIERVAEFYARSLSWPITERDPGFVIVGSAPAEIAIVRMSAAAAAANAVAVPPRIREDTPLKASFLVADLQATSVDAAATGGGTKPISSAWSWRGQLHLDGYDPEGNMVQFREMEASRQKDLPASERSPK